MSWAAQVKSKRADHKTSDSGIKMQKRTAIVALMLAVSPVAAQDKLPIFDAHVHYSHDAVDIAHAVLHPPGRAGAHAYSRDAG
jgi:hypothetical protein